MGEIKEVPLLALTLRLGQREIARGYSITTDAASGQILRVASEARPGQKLKTRLQKGEIRSLVEE